MVFATSTREKACGSPGACGSEGAFSRLAQKQKILIVFEMNPTATPHRPRLLTWFLVLVYGLGLPGVAPAVVMSLASISHEHEVEVALGEGHVDVVLHHDDDHHEHVHGELAKLMTGIATHDDDDDHVLHFASSSDSANVGAAAFNLASASGVWTLWQPVSFQSVRPAREAMQRHAARPPPLAPIGVLCLRTTVLLV